MAKLTKRARLAQEKIEPTKAYGFEEAVAALKELSTVKFKESVDISVNLGIDARKSDQNVRGSTVLPNGTGKDVRVAVFARGPKAEEAQAAGADIVGQHNKYGFQLRSGYTLLHGSCTTAEKILVADGDVINYVGYLKDGYVHATSYSKHR